MEFIRFLAEWIFLKKNDKEIVQHEFYKCWNIVLTKGIHVERNSFLKWVNSMVSFPSVSSCKSNNIIRFDSDLVVQKFIENNYFLMDGLCR